MPNHSRLVKLNKYLKILTVGICIYESLAIITNKYATLSRIAYKHVWFGPLLIIALAIHLSWPIDELDELS